MLVSDVVRRGGWHSTRETPPTRTRRCRRPLGAVEWTGDEHRRRGGTPGARGLPARDVPERGGRRAPSGCRRHRCRVGEPRGLEHVPAPRVARRCPGVRARCGQGRGGDHGRPADRGPGGGARARHRRRRRAHAPGHPPLQGRPRRRDGRRCAARAVSADRAGLRRRVARRRAGHSQGVGRVDRRRGRRPGRGRAHGRRGWHWSCSSAGGACSSWCVTAANLRRLVKGEEPALDPGLDPGPEPGRDPGRDAGGPADPTEADDDPMRASLDAAR